MINPYLWLYRVGPTLEEAHSWAKSFEHLIKSPNGRSNFRQFLKSEFSEENLMFWLACEELKKETNRTVVEQTVKQIYEDYVSVLSPKEVHLHTITHTKHTVTQMGFLTGVTVVFLIELLFLLCFAAFCV